MSKPACILLVEDNRMDVELTLDAFREVRLGHRVEVVGNGQQALDYLRGRADYADRQRFPLPDLILLDLKMPGIDGFEVLRQIKAEPRLKRIPVVVLTSSMEEDDRALSYDVGANSYLLKPLYFEGFLGVIRTIQEYWLRLNIGPPQSDRAAVTVA